MMMQYQLLFFRKFSLEVKQNLVLISKEKLLLFSSLTANEQLLEMVKRETSIILKFTFSYNGLPDCFQKRLFACRETLWTQAAKL